VLSDFREVTVYDGTKRRRRRSRFQDKGQAAMLKEFFGRVLDGGDPLIPMRQLYAVADACFAVHDSLSTNSVCSVRAIEDLDAVEPS
jgi:hypothetical protein